MNTKKFKLAYTIPFLVLGTIGLNGCKQTTKTTLTMYSMHASYLYKSIESLIETTYPDIDFVCEMVSYPTYQTRLLEHGQGPDLVLFNQNYGSEYQKYLVDISNQKYINNYSSSILSNSLYDGKSYVIPLPGEYYGYIINDSYYSSAGIAIPTTFNDFLTSIETLKDQNIGVGDDGYNFAIDFDYNSAFGTYYESTLINDYLGTQEGQTWSEGFINKTTHMGKNWEAGYSQLASYLEKDLLDPLVLTRQRNYIDYSKRMVAGELVSYFGDSTSYNRILEENQSAGYPYSYTMLPFFGSGANPSWTSLVPNGYLGINKSIETKKIEAANRVMALLSTPDGQTALLSDCHNGVSYLKNYSANQNDVPTGLSKTIIGGYVYNSSLPGILLDCLGSELRKVVEKTKTIEEMIDYVDKYYYEGEGDTSHLFPVGISSADYEYRNYNVRRGETELGNLVADSVAYASGAPIAVVNGGGIRSGFFEGEVYEEYLSEVCPHKNKVVVVSMSGRVLKEMLSHSLEPYDPEADIPSGRFLNVSGIKYSFNPKASGDKLVSVTTPNGKAIVDTEYYKVAINNYMAGNVGYIEGNGDGYTMLNVYDDTLPKGDLTLVEALELTYAESLSKYFQANVTVSSKHEGRISEVSGGN